MVMDKSVLKSDVILLATALIWGFSFVALREGMGHVGPFIFNGVRFALGSAVLLLVIKTRNNRKPSSLPGFPPMSVPSMIWRGAVAGLILFCGSSLVLTGIGHTTAGKAGFISALYVVIIPLLGLCWGQRTNAGTWAGVVLAMGGLYCLSVTEHFTIGFGDCMVLAGAIFMACHVLAIGWLSPKMDSYKLAFIQYAVCSLLSLISALLFETPSLSALLKVTIPILYGGVLSVGVAFTFQVIGQRNAPPAHAAILLCTESIFAALGGWLLLDELMSGRQILGCALMLAGVIISQLWTVMVEPARKTRNEKNHTVSGSSSKTVINGRV